MWWPFKEKSKETKVEIKPKPKKFAHSNKSFEVGKTKIEIALLDGRRIRCMVYGYVNQYTRYRSEHYKTDAICQDPTIMESSCLARNFITNLPLQEFTFLDDSINPTESYIGKAMRATILKSYPHTVEFQVASLKEDNA